MIITEGYWRLENDKKACVAFQLPATGSWYGVVEGEPHIMPRWWDKSGRDNRDSNYNLKHKLKHKYQE